MARFAPPNASERYIRRLLRGNSTVECPQCGEKAIYTIQPVRRYEITAEPLHLPPAAPNIPLATREETR